MRKTKLAMLQSVVALILCAAMLVGTTFAWFTDEVTSAVNKIQAGTLDVDLVDAAGNSLEGTSLTFMDVTGNTDILWEPGCTFKTQGFRVANRGSLALEYTMYINGLLGDSKLLEVIRFSVQDADGYTVDIDTFEGQLSARASSDVFYLVGHMDENAGNEYMNLTLTGIGITVYATQAMEENDSFGPEYDKDAFFPGLDAPILGSVNITTENDLLTADAYIDVEGAKVTIPAGTRVKPGTTTLKLRVKLMDETTSDVKLSDNQVLQPMDVTVEGVSDDNQVPLTVELYEIAPVGLNMGSIALHHVHKGVTAPMTRVAADAAFTADNQYRYDPATGDLALHMATFSEVAVVADTVNAWEGKLDYTWYDASKTALTIANADQLAAFGAIVGGMKKVTDRVDGKYTYSEEVIQDSFSGKTIKLVADINIGDTDSENGLVFYPIGYYNSEGTYERTNTAITSGLRIFEGTFDGNGHTVSNFYQNTWEMKGDHDWYSPQEQYYRDGMGLFGRVYGGTVKNLTIKNFSSDGEITTTGCVAAYADFGATFENIAIFNCNPRVYNIGNGGIVGCVGWYTKGETDKKVTFRNITVDNSNKISALWGSYDVACGGIVGQYYPTSGQSSANYPVNAGLHFENCHVSAVMDVYNDVCANYQYYAYRYTGMLIGSVRENETINGHVYPKMDKITATDCTVHFGDWNDYYYCEIIDNTTASYTHDYQMSRLTEIKAIDGTTITYLDGTTGTVPVSGRANYVIVDYTKGHGTENATCYHFKDGAVWTHEMGGIQTGIDENGDGKDDLKEDKQHIYLEFNNLVTGYGWGVTTMSLTHMPGVKNLDVDEGNYEESVNKFTPVINGGEKFESGTNVTVGEIFKAVDSLAVGIKGDNVQVTVSPFGATSTAGGTYVANTTDWTQGTLTFSGVGQAVITITDYYFCKTTSITVNITAAEKFATKFDEDFLYRVGNAAGSTVKLGTIFKAIENAKIDSSTVGVEIGNVAGNAKGTYTSHATWTEGTIQFSGTGVVKVTISAKDTQAFNLYLEVVDAVNATTATSAKANNVVLLNDCGFSSLEVSGGYALYGNGFTMTCGSDSVALDMGYSFVTLNNGTLDNVQIVCPNFDYAALYKSNLTSNDNRSEKDANGTTRYYNAKSGVMASGNSQILNSRISGGRAAVNVSGGNCVIDNSRIELGAVASILVGSANSLTLRDVTLIQKPTESTYKADKAENGTTIMGFSVLYLCDSEGKAAPTTLEGSFVQQAWVNADDKQYVPSAGQDIVDGVMKETAFVHNINGKDSLNLGFAYMPEDTQKTVAAPDNITDNRTDKATIPYEMKDVKIQISILSTTVYVYSYKNTNGTADSFKTETEYKPNRYSNIITVNYSDTADGLTTGKSFGTDGWTYELNVDLDKLSGYALDFSKLSMTVNGVTVTDFLVNGEAKPTSPVSVVAGGTTYTLTAAVDGKEYTATYKVTGTETSKESPSLVGTPSYGAGFGVANKYGGDWSAAAPVLDGITIKYWSVADSEYKEFALSSITFANTGKQNGTNNYWEYTHTNNDFTLKLTNTAAIHSNSGTYGMPVAGKDGKLYFTIASSGGFVSTGTTSRSITIAYEFTDNNGGDTLKFSHTWSIPYSKDEQYNYGSFTSDGTLTKLKSGGGGGGCVTGDTHVTLADGTQKRIDSLTGAETLLVWDFYKGTYTVVPAALVINHGTDYWNVIQMEFEDGTVVNAVSAHAFFDTDLNEFVMITPENTQEYVGHSFVKATENGYTAVKLVKCTASVQYTSSYSLVSAHHYNFLVEDMFSMTNLVPDLIAGLEIGENMKYDEATLAADIAQYGLYTYDDFADYITEAQFNAFNGAYLKISVGKGYITYEEIVELIISFVNN